MKKFVTLLTSIATLGLVAMVVGTTYAEKPPAPSNGNSHEKATGSIEAIMGSVHLYADFNGHETDPAKGEYHVWGNVGATDIDWYGEIDEVEVDGPHALLRGHATSGVTESGPVTVGQQFTLEMTDGGTPGAGTDAFASGWGTSAGFNWTIVSGNLVVHYNEPAELLSAVYEGTTDIYGESVGDTLTLTFSKNIEGNGALIKVYFQNALRLSQEWGKTDWIIDGNVLTVMTTAVYSSPREIVGDYVTEVQGLNDVFGNPVVVSDVEVVQL